MPILVNGSKDFDEFLEMLGDKVKLKGWTKYNGGLDIECKPLEHIFCI